MSTIIKNYLNDKSIPIDKRRNLQIKLNAGGDTKLAADAIIQKYGNKYGGGGEIIVDALKSVGITRGRDLVNPIVQVATAPQQLGRMVNQVAEQKYREAGADKYENIDQIPNKELRAIGSVGAQQELDQRNQQDLRNIAANDPVTQAGNWAFQTGKEALAGVGDVATGVVGVPVGLASDAYKAVTGQATDGGDAMRSLAKASTGVGRVLGSPVTGFIESSPSREIKEQAQDIMSLPNEGVKFLAKAINSDLDDEFIQENISNPIWGAASIAPASRLLRSPKAPKVSATPTAKTRADLRKAGLSEPEANLISNLSDEGRGVFDSYIQEGLKNLDSGESQRLVMKPAGEIKDWFEQVAKVEKEKGAQVGALKKPLKTMPVNKTIKKNILSTVKSTLDQDFNAIKNGRISLKKSDLATSAEARLVIKQLKAVLKAKKVTFRDLDSTMKVINQQIEKVKSTGLTASDPSIRFLTKTKNAIDDVVSDATPELKQAKGSFAQIRNPLDQVREVATTKAGSKAVFTPEKILDGLMGKNTAKFTEAMKAMQKVADETGVPLPKDLLLKAKLANMAERITGTRPVRGTESVFAEAAQTGLESLPVVGGAAKMVNTAKKIFGKTPEELKLGAQKIQQLLQTEVKKTPKGVLIPPNVWKTITTELKMTFGAQAAKDNQSD